SATGAPTSIEDVREALQGGLPVAVGSGVSPEDAPGLAQVASALIVGSYIKEAGDWRRPVDPARARALVRAVRG
ncbi:MAG: hypothetical protein KC933_37590, partial [Myxococcales bacterium]|nr:hypothetical protein [Myxococcales bacterium]